MPTQRSEHLLIPLCFYKSRRITLGALLITKSTGCLMLRDMFISGRGVGGGGGGGGYTGHFFLQLVSQKIVKQETRNIAWRDSTFKSLVSVSVSF